MGFWRRVSCRSLVVLGVLVGVLGLWCVPAFALSQRGHVFSFAFGAQGTGDGEFLYPSGVAVSSVTGDVYVADRYNDRVEQFQPELGSKGELVGEHFVREFAVPFPEGVAVDDSTEASDPSKGDVYVVGTTKANAKEAAPVDHLLYKFSSEGEPIVTLKKFKPEAASKREEAFEPLEGVAVDPGGALFVYQQDGTIARFNDAASNEGESSLRSQAKEGRPGFAVDSEGNFYAGVGPQTMEAEQRRMEDEQQGLLGFGVVAKLEASTGRVLDPNVDVEDTTAVAVNPADVPANDVDERNDVYLANVAAPAAGEDLGTVAAFNPKGALIQRFSAPGLREGDAIAVDSQTGVVYVADGASEKVDVFALSPEVPGRPQLRGVSAQSVAPSATTPSVTTLSGQVDPTGADTRYHFEYGTGSCPAACTASPETDVGEGFAEQQARVVLQGLPAGVYHYLLVASNELGTVASAEATITVLARGRPTVEGLSASTLASGVTWLSGQVDPTGADTHYHFEYGTGSCPAACTASPETDVGEGFAEQHASVELRGLPAGVYHYLLVASNQFGTVSSAEQTITVLAAYEPCPNAQPRTEQPYGLLLPDCRAYEQVSPLDKNGYDVLTPGGAGTAENLVRASVSGEAITYDSYGSFADPAGARILSRYVSRRGAGGWSTQNITPPYLASQTNTEAPYWPLVFTPELSMGVVSSDGATPGCNSLYLADIASESHQPLTNECTTEPEVQGASTDLSHIVFTPDNESGTLYEWVGGQLSEVDVANDGTSIAAHAGGLTYAAGFTTADRWHAVSDDGLRVFFTDLEERTAGYRQLYVRENPEQPQSPLNGEECTVSSDACTVEVSASQKTNGSGPGGTDSHGPQPAEYLGASVDGSKVFFDSRAELTNNANTGSEDSAANLYEYDLKSGVLTDLTLDAGEPEGAAVLGMVTAGEDGSYVYYVADGALAPGAAPGNCAAHPNESPLGATCNLYVQHYNGTVWTPPVFITTLAAGDAEDWLKFGLISGFGVGGPANNTARVTPDGTHLAFLSERSLTGYDNEPAEPTDCTDILYAPTRTVSAPCREVFSYDATQPASPDNPVCVSCNPSGAPPVGPSLLSEIANETPPFYYTPRNFSEDGSRLFFDSRDALVPQATNGRQNVYEYEDGHVYLISDGAGSYDSSFLDASPNGDDVFIATADQLVPQDRDSLVDVYDARVGGGFPVSVSPASACDNGDSCKGPVSPQPGVFGAPASATFSGAGNIVPAKQGVLPQKVLVAPKPLTRAQKLTKALKACKKDKSRKKRAACEKRARKKYGASKTKKAGNERRAR